MTNGKHALIVGVTGISGHSLARHLLANGWTVTGISRKAPTDLPDITHIPLDVTDRAAVIKVFADLKASHVFFVTWVRQNTEAENCRVNGQMLQNIIDVFAQNDHKVEHISLVTGLKHYLGSFSDYAKAKPETPFREEQPRLPGENFYYTQEDILWAGAKRDGYKWSVHRPHSIIGWQSATP